jgi:heme-degrading monooxygenase HmoA
MENMKVIFMVETKTSSDLDEKFNDWDANVHTPMTLKGPGMLKARRYKSVDPENSKGVYLVIYELENESAIKNFEKSPERKAAHQKMLDDWGEENFTVNWAGYFKKLPKE